jgi:hypothetical protein
MIMINKLKHALVLLLGLALDRCVQLARCAL